MCESVQDDSLSPTRTSLHTFPSALAKRDDDALSDDLEIVAEVEG